VEPTSHLSGSTRYSHCERCGAQLSLEGPIAAEKSRIALGCVPVLLPIRDEKENPLLAWPTITQSLSNRGTNPGAVQALAPQPDMPGSGDYKRQLVERLFKRCTEPRFNGSRPTVEVSTSMPDITQKSFHTGPRQRKPHSRAVELGVCLSNFSRRS